MNPSDELKALHAKYCALTGLDMKWSYEVESVWYGWWKEQNTEADLELTIKYLGKLYQKRPDILASCLRLRRLVADTLFFSQMCAEARKCVRVRQERTDKESVLRATGRTAEIPKDAVPVADVLDKVLKSEAFREFVGLKEKL